MDGSFVRDGAVERFAPENKGHEILVEAIFGIKYRISEIFTKATLPEAIGQLGFFIESRLRFSLTAAPAYLWEFLLFPGISYVFDF